MRPNKHILAIAILILSFALAGAYPRERENPKGLDLSPAQKEDVRKLRSEGAKQMVRMRSDLKVAHLEMRELLRDRKVDRGRLSQQIDEVSRLRADMMRAQMDQKLAMREILTDEQFAKLRDLKMHRIHKVRQHARFRRMSRI